MTSPRSPMTWTSALPHSTDRLRLRAFEPEDAERVHHWNQDAERARNLDFVWPPTSQESVRRWTQEMSMARFEGGDYRWVMENGAGLAVGTISTHASDPRNGTFHLAFAVDKDHRRRGYAWAAIGLVVRWYFDELRYQKVVSVAHAYNGASVALHQRLGFVQEGRLRRIENATEAVVARAALFVGDDGDEVRGGDAADVGNALHRGALCGDDHVDVVVEGFLKSDSGA